MYNEKYRTHLFYHESQKWLNTVLDIPQTMYHYTSVEVLKSIIEKQCMYATHINFLNDWEEYQMGYKILTEQIKESIEKYRDDFDNIIGKEHLNLVLSYFNDECLNVTTYNTINQLKKYREFREMIKPEVYSISFCKEKDLLSQWAIYAKESGVAIEFDFTDVVFTDASLEKTEKEKYPSKNWQEMKYFRYNRPHSMNYSNQELLELLHGEITEIVRTIKSPNWMTNNEIYRPTMLFRKLTALYNLVPYCKMDKFRAENEVRIAFMCLEDYFKKKEDNEDKIHKTKVSYRVANSVTKPYLKIGWEALKPNIYPIKKIIVGPGKNQEAVFRGIIHFVENQDEEIIPNQLGKMPFSEPMVEECYKTCKGILIQKSNIPYIF